MCLCNRLSNWYYVLFSSNPHRRNAGVFLAVDPSGDDISGTSDIRGDPYRFGWTVQGTVAAFHAAIFIHQLGLSFIHYEHPVLPYDGAAAAESFSVVIFSSTDIDMFRSQCSLWAREYTTMTYLQMP